MSPWGIVAISVSIAAGIVAVLIVGSLLSMWREGQRRQAPPVPTPPPDPAAIPAPVAEEEDPERILARSMLTDAREAAKDLALAATEVGIERRMLRAAERRLELRYVRDQREELEAEARRRVPRHEERRERPVVRVRDEAPTPQPRRPEPEPQPREPRRAGPTTQELDAAYHRGVVDRQAGVAEGDARQHAADYPERQGLRRSYWDGYGDRRQAAAPAAARQPAAPAAQPAQPAGAGGAAAMAE